MLNFFKKHGEKLPIGCLHLWFCERSIFPEVSHQLPGLPLRMGRWSPGNYRDLGLKENIFSVCAHWCSGICNSRVHVLLLQSKNLVLNQASFLAEENSFRVNELGTDCP